LYETLAEQPNAFVQGFDEQRAYSETLKRARELLDAQTEVHVERFVVEILSGLAASWFGLPTSEAGLQRLFVTSKFVFQPSPEPALRKQAQRAGPELKASYDELTKQPASDHGSFLAELFEAGANHDERTTAVMSLVSGFVTATYGSVMAALDSWIESGSLWRLSAVADYGALRRALVQALRERQGPTVLHRTCVKETTLGGTTIARNSRVVLGIGSASNDDAKSEFTWLFGGNYGAQKHACPAQAMAIGVMLGLIAALRERRDLKRLRRFVLGYARPLEPSAAPPMDAEAPATNGSNGSHSSSVEA